MTRWLLLAAIFSSGSVHAEPAAALDPVRSALATISSREHAAPVTPESPLASLITPLTQEQKAAARSALRSLLPSRPPEPVLVDLHSALSLLGDHDGAAQAAAALARLNPGRTDALRLQALSLLEGGHYQSAADVARRAYESGDQAAFAVMKLAEGRIRTSVPSPVGFDQRTPLGVHGTAATTGLPTLRNDDPSLPFKPAQRLKTGVQPPATDASRSMNAADLDRILPEYTLANYSQRDREDLASAVNAAATAAKQLYQKQSNPIIDTISGWSQSGKVANIAQTMDMVFGGALRHVGIEISGVQRSCIDHQVAVAGPVSESLPPDSRLKVEYIHLGGFPWPEHHAVLVYPQDTNPVRSGVVLDSWRKQSPVPANFVYPYTDWKTRFPLQTMGGEDTEEVRRARR